MNPVRRLLPYLCSALIISGILFAGEFSNKNPDYQITRIHGKITSSWRNYNIEISPMEMEYIYFIISTLGNKSLAKIWKEESSLKKAGDRIDHIHPLKFLMAIFTDEDLKVAIANLRESHWVWGKFKNGLYDSLSDELANDNMPFEYIQDFADTLGIDMMLILPSISQSNWDELLSILIKNVPREGDPTRYDM